MEPSSEQKENKDTLDIYTTIYPLEDFTKKIGGEYVNVKSVYPPNVEAHTYEPRLKNDGGNFRLGCLYILWSRC